MKWEEMITPKVGMQLYGYCNGYFGRDSYEDKRIEIVSADYIVCRDEDGHPEFLNLKCINEEDCVEMKIPKDWLVQPKEEVY